MGDDDPLCWLVILHNTSSLHNARVKVSELLHFDNVRNTKDNKIFTGSFPVNFGPVQYYA